MIQKITFLLLTITFGYACQPVDVPQKQNVITSDIPLFWKVYDELTSIADSAEQVEYLTANYIEKGSVGLDGIIKARNYTSEEFVNAINKYPKFWNSIRDKTLKVDKYAAKAETGIEKLKTIYPELKPAKIFYTIGALRTPGTTIDSIVLLGAEMCMGDDEVDTSEFDDRLAHLPSYFKNNPNRGLEFLNVHEYVHTQQNEMVYNLLSLAVYEGAAEFVAAKAVGEKDITPAIHFGNKNAEAVREKFEEEMFNVHKARNGGDWIWNDTINVFKIRDLGYYIGYSICDIFYESHSNKKEAIKTIIELDYNNEKQIEEFVNGTNFFSAPLQKLNETFERKRPQVVNVSIGGKENERVDVAANENTIVLTFSEEMDKRYRNFELGPLGEKALMPFKELIGFSEDGMQFSYKASLKSNHHHQMLIGNGFRNLEGIPLKPFLIDFKTK